MITALPRPIDVEQSYRPTQLLDGYGAEGRTMRIPTIPFMTGPDGSIVIPLEIDQVTQHTAQLGFTSRPATLRPVDGDPAAVSLTFRDESDQLIPFSFATLSFDQHVEQGRDSFLYGWAKLLAAHTVGKRGRPDIARKMGLFRRTEPMVGLIMRQSVDYPDGVWDIQVVRGGEHEGTMPNDVGLAELALWHITRRSMRKSHRPYRRTRFFNRTPTELGDEQPSAYRRVGHMLSVLAEEQRDTLEDLARLLSFAEIVEIARDRRNYYPFPEY